MLAKKAGSLLSVLALIAGCTGSEGTSTDGGTADQEGACVLTCEGETYGCEATAAGECNAAAFDRLPRCLYQLDWYEGTTCAEAGP